MGDILEVIIYNILYFIVRLVLGVIHMIQEEYSVRRKKVTTKKERS